MQYNTNCDLRSQRFRSTASLTNLRRRAELLRNLRRFFDDKGFVEVQTPILAADVILDRYVEPISISDASFPQTIHGNRTFYLQTSPEFAMKRLLAAGMEAIYQLGPVFRKGDRGRLHNVEFTMLEWYRVGDDYLAGMSGLAELAETVLEKTTVSFQTFRDAFWEATGINPHFASCETFAQIADFHDISYPKSFFDSAESTDHWIDLIFSECVQPNLKSTIVYDFPATQSQLAQTRLVSDSQGDYFVAERFELFLDGIEIANGYHELLDAKELRKRFQKIYELRKLDGSPEIPVESRLLSAMESGLPASSGCALGVDRLLMAMLGADSIDDVLAFPIEIA